MSLAATGYGDYLAWGMMLLVLVMIVATLRRQHRLLLPHLDDATPELQKSLFALARSRGWMLCLLWFMLTLSVVLGSLQRAPGDAAETPPPAVIAPAPIVPQAAPVSAPITREQALDRIKLFYEDAFVSYYYLGKCRAAKAEDNAALYTSLLAELSTYGAEGEARKVIDAASGSFEVIYSESPCDEKTITPVRRSFDALMATLPERRVTVPAAR